MERQDGPPGEGGSELIDALVTGNTAFALDMYRALREREGNLFLSPHSISVAFGMTYAGARGETERQMAHVLRFPPSQETLHPAFARLQAHLRAIEERGQVELKIANSLWLHAAYDFLDTFLALMREHYGVTITPVDYNAPEEARCRINVWVEERTQGKIEELIPEGILNALTRLVLTNAIYFKGAWATPFNERMTQQAPFHVSSRERVRVPMMAQTENFGYAELEDLQLLELPYEGQDLAMVVLLPRQRDGLGALEEQLSVESLARWTAELRRREVAVAMPRFRVTLGLKLNDVLTGLGMEDAFDATKANFAGMDGNEEGLFISAAFHKAFVEVDEKGTEAAAATAVVMALRSAMLFASPPVFRADHPFLFLIRERSTGSILFLGRVVNPA
jgi:serpin B